MSIVGLVEGALVKAWDGGWCVHGELGEPVAGVGDGGASGASCEKCEGCKILHDVIYYVSF